MANLQADGFSLLRVLSDRERSKVFLARDASGGLRAVKFQQPNDPNAVAKLSARYRRLQPLTNQTGLLPILSHGLTDTGWLTICLDYRR